MLMCSLLFDASRLFRDHDRAALQFTIMDGAEDLVDRVERRCSTKGSSLTLPDSTSSSARIEFGRAAPVAQHAGVKGHQVRQAHGDLVHGEADHA
jgi:hypothetical protein